MKGVSYRRVHHGPDLRLRGSKRRVRKIKVRDHALGAFVIAAVLIIILIVSVVYSQRVPLPHR
jgi:hypothetical protein